MTLDPADFNWRKSSRSGHNGNCVEVASVVDHVGLRDSKNQTGAALVVVPRVWDALVSEIKFGRYDI